MSHSDSEESLHPVVTTDPPVETSDTSPTDGSKIDSIHQLESVVLEDVLNSDKLVALLELSDDSVDCVKFEALQAMGRIFLHFLESGDLMPQKKPIKTCQESPAVVQSQALLLDKFILYRSKLANSICNSEYHLAELHETAKQLMLGESAVTGTINSFLYDRLVTRLISQTSYTDILYELFEKDLEFCDVIHCCLCTLRRILTTGKAKRYSNDNILKLIMSLQKPLPLNKSEFQYLVHNPIGEKRERKDFLKLISKVWLQFLSFGMSHDTLVRVLRVMDTDILPSLTDPRVLLDFLTSSLDSGGVLSILSLKSLIILIHKHKLEYPGLYTKLYTLLKIELTYSEHFGEFLVLFDLVTTSTHLPQYVVAAYMKRLARIALLAPAHSIRPMLILISNLVVRHPNCSIMLHRTDREYPNGDPYLPEEEDPIRSKAIDSCLWELETLKYHYCDDTAGLVGKLFRAPLKRKERSITPYLGSYEQTINELEKKCLEDIENDRLVFKKPNVPTPDEETD